MGRGKWWAGANGSLYFLLVNPRQLNPRIMMLKKPPDGVIY